MGSKMCVVAKVGLYANIAIYHHSCATCAKINSWW